MRYLVYTPVPKKLSDIINSFNKKISKDTVRTSHPKPHCTLFNLYSSEGNEKAIIKALETIEYPYFKIKIKELKGFDEDSLVFRTNNDSARSLHLDIIGALREFTDFNKVPPLPEKYESDLGIKTIYKVYGSPYCATFFNAHVTVCYLKPGLVDKVDKSDLNQLIGYSWNVKEFHVYKKEYSKKKGLWKGVGRFSLRNSNW